MWNLKRNDTDELILKTEILTDLENKLAKWEEWGKGWSGSVGWICTHWIILNGLPKRTSCRTHGTLLNVVWQPGWEWSLGENGCMRMCG